jgi:hypothetical protein
MLDLEPIKGRRQAALATADMVGLLAPTVDGPTRARLLKELGMAAARSSADIDDLVNEIEQLRLQGE